MGGPPNILRFTANADRLTEGETLRLAAVVTDPDGVRDLIGGVLEAPSGASYGPFVRTVDEGAFSLEIAWRDLHRVAPIEFGQGAQQERQLVARFFDQAGGDATSGIVVQLHCGEVGACDGGCVDLATTPRYCGACDNACEAPADRCVGGECACPAGERLCDDGDCRADCRAVSCEDFCAAAERCESLQQIVPLCGALCDNALFEVEPLLECLDGQLGDCEAMVACMPGLPGGGE